MYVVKFKMRSSVLKLTSNLMVFIQMIFIVYVIKHHDDNTESNGNVRVTFDAV